MNGFWLALSFLTRLPVPSRLEGGPTEWGRSLLFYPLVGALLGGVLVSLQWLMVGAPNLGAALLILLWILVTGGLHLDGLADCADGWIGGQADRERALLIMKDSRSGPMAIAAVVGVLLVKYGALVELSMTHAFWPLFWAPLLSRTALPFWLATTPYVSAGGLGSSLSDQLPRRAVPWVIAGVLLLAMICLGFGMLLLTVIVVLGLRRLMMSWMGGCTGDLLGAATELLEAALLAGAVLLSGDARP